MTGKDEFVPYSPLPSNPYPPPPQNVVVLLPPYRPNSCRRYRRCLRNSAAALFAVLLLSAAVYVFYPSDPEIRVVRIGLNRIRIRTSPKPILDLSFSLTVKVRNRDFFSLTYDSLVVAVGYRGRNLGLVTSGGGRVRARGSSYVDATLSVNGFEIIYDVFYLLEDLARGVIPFDTETRVKGKLGLLFFKIPLKATVSCEVYVNIKDQTIVRQDCYPESLGSDMKASHNNTVMALHNNTVEQSAHIGAAET